MNVIQPSKRDHSFTIWYFLVMIAYIVLDGFPDVKKYFIWLKPIPVLLLILQLHSVKQNHSVLLIFEIALFFGMIGDILLQISGSDYYFQIGVVAFFIGHVSYIIAYFKSAVFIQAKSRSCTNLIVTFIYFIVIAGAMMTNLHFIFKNLQDLQKIAFSIYAGFLTLMTTSALFLAMRSRSDSNMKIPTIWIYLGSLLFLISDTTLSQRKENDRIDQNSKKIMGYVVGGTYWLAQFLIAEGAMRISSISQQQRSLQNNQKINSQNILSTQQTITQPLIKQ